MVSLMLTQKWWLGLVAGAFGVLGVGTTLVAMPAFADAGGSQNAAGPRGLEVRLECKKGDWSQGSFTLTTTGAAVTTALTNCPNGTSRTITVPVPKPATGVAIGSFSIHVSGKAKSGATAVCDFPVPNLGSQELRRKHVTYTCAVDGAARDGQAHMKIKVRWTGQGDDNNGSESNRQNQSQNGRPNSQQEDDGPGKSKDKGKDNSGSSQGNREDRGWLSSFSRGRGR